MPDLMNIVYAVQLEATNLWIYTVVALVLGLLHPFEPGRTGDAVAAVIGGKYASPAEAGRTGFIAALQDTLVLWITAFAAKPLAAMDIGLQDNEPYIVLISGALVIVAAFRLFNLQQMKLEPGYLLSATAFAGLKSVPAGAAFEPPVTEAGSQGGISAYMPGPSVVALMLLCLQLDFLGTGTDIALSFCAGLTISIVALSFGGRALRLKSAPWASYAWWSGWLPSLSVFLVIIIGLLSIIHGLTDMGL